VINKNKMNKINFCKLKRVNKSLIELKRSWYNNKQNKLIFIIMMKKAIRMQIILVYKQYLKLKSLKVKILFSLKLIKCRNKTIH
jgi:hypothetical protein